MERIFFIITIILLSACATGSAQSPETLLAQLQQGGYVLYFRHAVTDHSQKDSSRKDFADCSTQRNLNTKGRQQSTVIGQQIKKLDIPIGAVISSYMCRCVDTAKLAFGKVSMKKELTSIVGVSVEERNLRAMAIRSMLATAPVEGTNTVIVSHKHMFHDAAGIWIDEGEAAIFKPQGDESSESYKFVTRVKANAWNDLAQKNKI